MYLKEKADSNIKGRGCADGRKQREYIEKSDAAPPTLSVEAAFITSVIDAFEYRDVATVDILGTYLRVDYDTDTLVRFNSTMAELLVKISPKIYKSYIEFGRNGNVVLYAKLKKLYTSACVLVCFFGKICQVISNIKGLHLTPMTHVLQIN